jgi:hypothetical protein
MRNIGIGVGMVLAVIISWTHLDPIVWIIIHGALGWLYVVYFLVVHYHLLGA